jgi:nuclear migration protein JNM1
MSANKYADLPDIVSLCSQGNYLWLIDFKDTAPDIYETEDVFPSSQDNVCLQIHTLYRSDIVLHQKDDSSEDEISLPTRSARNRNGDGLASKDELDSSSLIGTEEASKRFRKAEKRRGELSSLSSRLQSHHLVCRSPQNAVRASSIPDVTH